MGSLVFRDRENRDRTDGIAEQFPAPCRSGRLLQRHGHAVPLQGPHRPRRLRLRARRHAFPGNLSRQRLLRRLALRHGLAGLGGAVFRQAGDAAVALHEGGRGHGAPADLWPAARQRPDDRAGADPAPARDLSPSRRQASRYRLHRPDGLADGVGHDAALHRRHPDHPALRKAWALSAQGAVLPHPDLRRLRAHLRPGRIFHRPAFRRRRADRGLLRRLVRQDGRRSCLQRHACRLSQMVRDASGHRAARTCPTSSTP